MSSDRWNIVSCDPETGRIGLAPLASTLTSRQVIEYLRHGTGFKPEELAKFAVGEALTLKRFTSAERWMEDHAVDYVLSAWMAGGRAARESRQEKLREWWPDLALALDNLEANSASS